MDNETIASRLRAIIVEDPLAAGGDIKATWKERGETGTITDQSISTAKTILKKKLFCDEFPVHLGKLTVSGVVRNIIAANPQWGDSQVMAYMQDVGIEATRALISNVRSVAKNKHKVKVKKVKVKKADNFSPDPNQNSGPRAKKSKLASTPTKDSGSFVEIERQLDELISKIDAIGQSGLADQARRVRRLASAQLLE